jgi:hypothetical protein
MTAAVLLAVSFLIVGTGCYTVLRHPTGSDVVREGAYYRSCADCHADAPFYHPYGHRYYRYGRSHYGWGGYYGRPWWYDNYWWWDHHDDDDYDDYDGPRVETRERHLWSEGGWAPQGWGFSRPGTSPPTSAPPSRPRDDGDEKKNESKKKEEKKEDKDKRSLWDNPKRGF